MTKDTIKQEIEVPLERKTFAFMAMQYILRKTERKATYSTPQKQSGIENFRLMFTVAAPLNSKTWSQNVTQAFIQGHTAL